MMSGVATVTMVMSTRIMKKPMTSAPERGPRSDVGGQVGAAVR